jgi:DNA-binding PadR family transcriptional regulator
MRAANDKDKTSDMLPLTPAVLHILLALADGSKHGYGIMQEVKAISDGRVKMGPGTLYGSIKRMLAAGLIKETGDRPAPELDDKRRRYYEITGFGQGVLSAEARRLSDLLLVAKRKRLLGGVEGG